MDAGDEAGLEQVDHAVDEHLGVHAEVADPASEQRADGVRHGADADLEAGAVLDLRDDQRRDLAIDVAGGRVRELRRRLAAAVDDVVHLAHVHRSSPPNTYGIAGDVSTITHLGALDHRLLIGDGAPKLK